MADQEVDAAPAIAGGRDEVIRYSEDQRAAIVAVAEAARAAGKTWAETVEEAHKAGYKGPLAEPAEVPLECAEEAKQ